MLFYGMLLNILLNIKMMRYFFEEFGTKSKFNYINIFMYIKIMKNDKFNLKIIINEYKNENLLNRVVIPST